MRSTVTDRDNLCGGCLTLNTRALGLNVDWTGCGADNLGNAGFGASSDALREGDRVETIADGKRDARDRWRDWPRGLRSAPLPYEAIGRSGSGLAHFATTHNVWHAQTQQCLA